MNKLRHLREQARLTLRQLAEYTGLSHSLLHYLEDEKRVFRQNHISILCYFFDCTSDYLLGSGEVGIGVYFNSSDDDEDHTYITEEELSKLECASIVRDGSVQIYKDTNFIVLKPFYKGAHIYRDIPIKKEDSDINDSIDKQIIMLLSKMTIFEKERLLKFIKEFL